MVVWRYHDFRLRSARHETRRQRHGKTQRKAALVIVRLLQQFDLDHDLLTWPYIGDLLTEQVRS